MISQAGLHAETLEDEVVYFIDIQEHIEIVSHFQCACRFSSRRLSVLWYGKLNANGINISIKF